MSQSDPSTAIKEAKDAGLKYHEGEWKQSNKKKHMAKKMTKASHIFPKEFRKFSFHDEMGRQVKKANKNFDSLAWTKENIKRLDSKKKKLESNI